MKSYLNHKIFNLIDIKELTAIEGNTQLLEENRLILIPPNKDHSYYSADGNKNKVFVICFQCFSQALRPLSETKFDLKSELIDYMEKIIAESLATFRMNEEDLLEVMPTPVIGGQQMIILLLESLLTIIKNMK